MFNKKDTPKCGHEEELKVLRDIARLAGEWGIAFANLQVSPSKARRNKAANIGRQMSNALEYYDQFKREQN